MNIMRMASVPTERTVRNAQSTSPERTEGRIIEGVFPRHFPSITTLWPDHLIQGFYPYLATNELELFIDYASRDKVRLLGLIEEAAVEYERGTADFFRAVIAFALHQSE